MKLWFKVPYEETKRFEAPAPIEICFCKNRNLSRFGHWEPFRQLEHTWYNLAERPPKIGKNEKSKKKHPENLKIAGFSQNRYHHRFQRKKLRRFLRSILFFDQIWSISWPCLLFYGNWHFSAPHFSAPDAHFKLQNHFTALFWIILHLPRLSLTYSETPKKIAKNLKFSSMTGIG